MTITEIPDNEVILNDADVTFTSQPNPQEPPITEMILTNLVVTTINIASIFPLKLVDKEVATVGEILTYDVLILISEQCQRRMFNLLIRLPRE